MIRVAGTAKILVDWETELDMTEEEFDSLDERELMHLLDKNIDWLESCRSGELNDVYVGELIEIEE